MRPVKTIIISSSITLLLVTIAFSFLYLDLSDKIRENQDSTKARPDSHLIQNNLQPASFQTLQDQNALINKSRHNVITQTVSKVSPAVVGINVTEIKEYRDPRVRDPFWGRFFQDRVYQQAVKSLGSGVIISPDGYIITNDHVAGNAVEAIVTMSNGDKYNAKFIGSDRSSDLCVLKIEGENFPYVTFAEDGDILIGEWSIALGNPFGLFAINDKPTVTVGVVSSINMNIGAQDNRYYLDMIQTDASINSGNSGGPLVNSMGDLIGINTIIYSQSGGSVGVGFAIPIERVRKIVGELIAEGEVDRNYWTGLYADDISDQVAKYYNLDKSRGVVVTNVTPGSPADKAGIQPYDIICKAGDYVVKNITVLKGAIQNYRTGEIVNLDIIRNKDIITKKMKLERKK